MDKIKQCEIKNFCPIKQTVEFIDIKDHYTTKEDLTCRYKLKDYKPQEGDRVSLYQFGWNFVKDYVLFEWASLVPSVLESNLFEVTFNRHNLPKNLADMYQLCYISVNNDLQGASAPFSIHHEDSSLSTDSLSFVSNSKRNVSKSSTKSNDDDDKDRIIKKLREENSVLKECLKALVAQKQLHEQNDKRYNNEYNQLKEITEKLYSKLKLQEKEIKILKTKIVIDNGEDNNTNKIKKDFDFGELQAIPPFPKLK